jgi:anaerobic magnesium-protoporphyrin IX monomethyl ester cyclase
LDQELMDLFVKAGVYRIHFGIETVNERVQQIVNKKLNIDKLNHAIGLVHKARISSHGFFIIGFPTETMEEMQENVDYAVKSKLSTANFSILKIFPGTMLAKKYLKDEDKIMFNNDFSFSYESVNNNLSLVSDEDLKKFEKKAMMRFYLRPWRIWNIFITTPNKKKLIMQNVFTVFNILFKGKAKY